MRLKVLIPYREFITYQEMSEALEREVEELGWALSKSGGRLVDLQTEIIRDCSAYGYEVFEKPGTTKLAISAQIHMPYRDGKYGVDPHGD